MSLFASYCFDKQLSMDNSYSALRDYFISHLRSVDFIDDNVVVKSVCKAIRRKLLNLKKEQLCSIESSFRNGLPKQAPTTYDMLRDLRDWCFITGQEVKLSNCQIYLGAAVQYCSGLRASNVCWKGQKSNHYLKSNDVV